MSHPHRSRPIMQPGGPHELGQNDLVDRRIINRIVRLAVPTSSGPESMHQSDRRACAASPRATASEGPIVEWGPGNGALSTPLIRRARHYIGVEIDLQRAARLRRRFRAAGPHVCIVQGDLLRHAPPAGSTVVSNVPFHITTPVLRHLFREAGWHRAVLLVQWEVARKRAGVGGATQFTAEVWPWFEVSLDRRVPARAFRPVPSVDAGLLLIERRTQPLLPGGARTDYQRFVRRTFRGPGRGISDILARTSGMSRSRAGRLCGELGIPSRTLPRDLTPRQWADLFLRS